MSDQFKGGLIILIASIVSGAISGAIASWMFADSPRIADLNILSTTSTVATQDTAVTVIPIDRRRAEPLIPPAFLNRESSAVGVFSSRNLQDGLLTDEELVGQAVAVTSDGWLLLPAEMIGDRSVSDLVFWHAGQTATSTEAVYDERSDAIYVKTSINSLQAPAFAHYQDLTIGLQAWVERKPQSFEPVTITALGVHTSSLNGVESDRANRRVELSGQMMAGEFGSPVWSHEGAMIGVLIGEVGEGRQMIPSSAWVHGLTDLLNNQRTIRHAYLGIRGIDLSFARLTGLEGRLTRGFLLRRDATRGLPAIDAKSPAAEYGLEEGDVILAIDRDILDGSASLAEILSEYRPQSEVTLSVLRDGVTIDLPVTLGEEIVSARIGS